MAENPRFDNRTKSLSIISIIIISSILLLFGWTTSVSESLNVEVQPAVLQIQNNVEDSGANAQNTAKKLKDTKGEKIPNQYIVVLKGDDFLSSPRASASKATSQGAELRHIYNHALRGYAVKVPNDKVLVEIMKSPEVDYVQPDIKMEAFAQSLPTGVNRVDGDLSSTRSGNGAGTVNLDIGILDTGIQLSHPDLYVYKHVTFVSGTSTGNDDNGHGTSVAGIAAAKDNSAGVVGIAPGARLWAIKVLANNGVGMSSDIIKGIDYATEHADEIDVVNLSFGGEGSSDALHTAISRSVAGGVTYVAAAGNQGRDASSFVPASFPEVITVSAIVDTDGKCGGLSSVSTSYGKDDTFASFSNHGSAIDMAAPGVQIKTTARGSSYTSSFTGTSASAPHVAGAAALYKVEHTSASPSDIRNALASLGSLSSTICDGNGHGYFTGDKDSIAEPLLYIASESILPEPQCTTNLPISSATASGSEATHPPTHAIDNNFGTRWANPALGSWIRADLGSIQNICSVDIAWYNGMARQYHFVIATSTDGTTFTNVFSGDSSGTTASSEKYTIPATDARYVRVTINGNTQNSAASIYELDVFGSSSLLAELPPVANNQVVTTNKNTAKAITLTATDPNNDLLTYSLVTQPAHGTITGVAPNLMYNPTTGYVGPDSFKFKANDGIADSNNATVSVTVRDPGVCTTNLPISSATASGSEATHPPTHAIDNNFGTRWANPALGSWIRADLGSIQNICSVDIAWYNGFARQYHFVIATSTNGIGFSNVFSGDSSGTTASSEKYIIPATDARYVKVTINGNTQNSAASIYELDIFGSPSGNSPPVSNNQAVAVNKNTAKTITLTATDPNNDPLTYSIVTPPEHGTLTGTVTASDFIYNPDTDYLGPDTFTFKTNDGIVDSNIATVSITVQDAASCTTNLPISGVTASASESANPASNAIDNNFGTRWANPALGSWIRADLGSIQNICSVDIAWYNGNARQYHFVIATSTDGTTFTNVFSGDSSGTTTSSEKYIIPATDARYVRITINGNTQNNAASIYEIDVFGSLSSSTTGYHFEPSMSLAGPN